MFLRVTLTFLFALGLELPAAGADALEAVLARMDQEAAGFRDLTAQLTKTSYTAVLNESSQESGSVWIKRSGARDLMMKVEFTGPNERALGFENSRGQIYYPKIQTVQIFDLGKSRRLVDQFLLLGFGTPGKEVAKNYRLAVAGEEAAAGQKCTRLELIPKSTEVLQHLQKVELWIPENAGHPVQQKLFQLGGDYTVIIYTDLKLNPKLPETAFRLNLPKDVKREYPQK
jgi:outer membrane lipoprotein-sorting protein